MSFSVDKLILTIEGRRQSQVDLFPAIESLVGLRNFSVGRIVFVQSTLDGGCTLARMIGGK